MNNIVTVLKQDFVPDTSCHLRVASSAVRSEYVGHLIFGDGLALFGLLWLVMIAEDVTRYRHSALVVDSVRTIYNMISSHTSIFVRCEGLPEFLFVMAPGCSTRSTWKPTKNFILPPGSQAIGIMVRRFMKGCPPRL